MKQFELHVTGMDCTGCERRIETGLSRLSGVVRTKADHQTGVVSVVIEPGQVTEDTVRDTIKKIGYGVE